MYDFCTMSEKDVFQARLKHEIIPFGFVPVWKMKSFLKFCVKYGLLQQPPEYMECAYEVEHKFSYNASGSRVRHMPFGRVIEWIADYFYAPEHNEPLNGYVKRYEFLIRPRGTRPGYTYVMWYEGLIQ